MGRGHLTADAVNHGLVMDFGNESVSNIPYGSSNECKKQKRESSKPEQWLYAELACEGEENKLL
jgi:hypothetical protein